MEYVAIARANPGKTTSETYRLYQEWIEETYGELSRVIDGRRYPPGEMPEEPFKGSILYKGKTAEERRAILRGERIEIEIDDIGFNEDYAAFEAMKSKLQIKKMYEVKNGK